MPFFPQRHKNKIIIIFLSALLCLLLSSLWLLKRREGFFNDDAKADAALIMDSMLMDRLKANAIANDLAKEQGNVSLYPKGAKSIYIGDERYGAAQADYDLNTIAADIINKNPYQKINWSTVEFDTTKNVQNTIGAIHSPSNKVPIMIDSCSTLGFLNSEFKTDICTTHAGDNITINKKCQELSATNCTLPSCCVLVNGTCMAGNNNGPTFGTHNGMTIDYNYYYYKDKCYGDCGSDANQIRASKEAAIVRAQAEAEAKAKAKALAEKGDNKRAGRANLINSLAENPTAQSTNSLLSTFKFSKG